MKPARATAVIAVASLFVAGAAHAEIVHMAATIDVAQETPASDGSGSGHADITVDTAANTLTYHVVYSGLTSPEIAAHIHGPAARGEVSFTYLYWFPLGPTKDGVWNYPENLEADILAGRTYVNIHTQTWNTGEIRGQIEQAVPAGTRAGWLALAVALLVTGAWFRLRSARRTGAFAAALLLLSIGAWKAGAAPAPAPPAVPARPAASEFRTGVDHPYFPLVPGTVFRYREKEGGRTIDEVVTVMREPRVVAGVRCVVVHDVEKHGARIVEDTYDWYAQDSKGNVWYFGEDSKEYGRDGRVHTGGSWEAGVRGAEAGILMPAVLVPGPEYRQEYSPGVAEDMGKIEAVGDTVRVAAGRFAGCVRTRDWSLIEPGVERKWYARGIGFVKSRAGHEDNCELLSVKRP